jgi:hypothetical protein
MLGGCAAFLVIAFLGIVVSLGAAGNISKLAFLNRDPTNTGAASQLLGTDTPTEAPLALYAVPTLSLSDAQANVTAHPNDPIGYLALAKALWQNGQLSAIQDTLKQGYNSDKNKTLYLLTAGELADETGYAESAVALYLLGFEVAQNNPRTYAFARELAGNYLYTAASTRGSNLPVIIRTVQRLDGSGSLDKSFLATMGVARSQITQGRLFMADRTLQNLSVSDSNAAEILLVRGELYQSEGGATDPTTYWQRAAGAPDAPDWVKTRANELIAIIRKSS